MRRELMTCRHCIYAWNSHNAKNGILQMECRRGTEFRNKLEYQWCGKGKWRYVNSNGMRFDSGWGEWHRENDKEFQKEIYND